MQAKLLSDWLSWLETLHPIPIDMRSSRFERLHKVASALDLLPLSCPVVTVAGTNGKGSTVSALESMLTQEGYRVGAYTSPHLLSYNERVRVQQQAVDDEKFCAAFEKINAARGDDTLTYFEFGTLAALLIFAQSSLDVVILEVGMGGRLDAVNMVDADVAVITTLALDHTEWLGKTREKIAYEKAGIIRSQRPVVCGDFDMPRSIKTKAAELLAPLYCQAVDFGYEEEANSWSFWANGRTFSNLPLPSIELQNAATALQALLCLEPLGVSVERKAINAGLAGIYLPGRFQIIPGAVERILDVAHNPHATTLLAKRLSRAPCHGKTLAVIAMLTDKDRAGSVKPLLPYIDGWFVSGLQGPRGDSGQALVTCLQDNGIDNIYHFFTVQEAYAAALAEGKSGDRVVVFGSFHTVAEVMRSIPIVPQDGC